MKTKFWLLAVTICLASLSVARGDTLVLKGGRSFDGEIIRKDEKAVLFRLPSGVELEYAHDQILSLKENTKGKDSPVRTDDMSVSELLKAAADFELVGKFTRARECYQAALERGADSETIQGRLREMELAQLVFVMSHPEQVAAEALQALHDCGTEALPVMERFLEAELRLFESWTQDNKINSLRLTLMRELSGRRKQALAFIFDKIRYMKDRSTFIGQAQAHEHMRNVRILYENASDTAFLKLHRKFGSNYNGLDLLLEAYKYCKGNKKTIEKAEGRMITVLRELHSRLDFTKADRNREDWKVILEANQNFNLSAKRKELGLLINHYRMTMGMPPMLLNKLLNIAAQSHSEEMDELDYFAHNSPVAKNEDPQMRIENAGYQYTRRRPVKFPTGEVLTEGPVTPEDALISWQESPDHHRAMLRKWWEEFGVGLKDDLWTVNMAVPARPGERE